jgi:four helix bundle protein
MSKITSFRDLLAWQKAMDLVDLVYEVTEDFPPRERYGLAYQMRKSSVSIASNISEGTRYKTAGYVYRLTIALGSHGELDTQCEVASRRQYVSKIQKRRLDGLLTDVGRLTHGLVRSLDPNYDN